jgi:phosphoribosylformylglycinamidine (FGAM) synthase-like amidotransferase family enzyme
LAKLNDLAPCESLDRIARLGERPSDTLPGGFSFGNNITGRILAQQLKALLSDMVESFRGQDRLVLGICNGMQIMMRLGIFFSNQRIPRPR